MPSCFLAQETTVDVFPGEWIPGTRHIGGNRCRGDREGIEENSEPCQHPHAFSSQLWSLPPVAQATVQAAASVRVGVAMVV